MGKAIVIGASSGIGKEVAEILINEGWTVGLAARRDEMLLPMIHAHEDRVKVAKIDVTASDAAESLNTLIKQIGGMDLFFYAAGIGKQNKELEESIELSTVRTNALGFTRMIGEAYRYFAAHGGGHIAAISSIAGTKGLGPAPSYSATKAMQATYLQALEQLAHSQGLNITFTDIRPGFVDTDLLSGTHKYPMLMEVKPVAKAIVKAVKQKKHVVVIDWKWRLLTALWRRIPRWLWRKMKL
jgi:short-subunit dehydrogenase